MGILAPLYLAGLAALSLPLIFHLVRRTPRGRQVFSSLMFLAPSPPRLTRRSRLDQIFLLLLRLAALALVAFAFCRPFLREAALLSFENLPQRRVAIVLDTSASMRRGDLWKQAIAQVQHELDQLAPHDEIALFTFDDRLQTIVGFDAATADASTSRGAIVRERLASLQPTWGATDLGTALVTVAGELDAASDIQQHAAEPQIVLISDFQKGARLEALQAFEWPKRVQQVTARQLAPQGKTNAFAQLLVSEEDTAASEIRVRVVNAADADGDQCFVRWTDAGLRGKPDGTLAAVGETAVYVPPGQSRVVKLPRPESNLLADRIVLRGDDHEFDNTYYVVPPRKQQVKLLYAGSDKQDDPQGLLYYLRLAAGGDPLRQVTIEPLAEKAAEPISADEKPHLIVVARAVTSGEQAALRTYVQRGGTLLLVPTDRDAAALVPALLDDVELGDSAPAQEGSFLLLGEIDFTHPLFAPLANPRYSDFTKIHFWRHQPVKVAGTLRVPSIATTDPTTQDGTRSVPTTSTHVVARFDNGDPAVLERTLGQGRVLVLTSGWQPDDSQLALSSKFVPLVGAVLDLAAGGGQSLASVTVGEAVALPASGAQAAVIHRPDGHSVKLPAGATSFDQTTEPGVYRADSTTEELRFAVNLAAAESNTAPLELEQLEQLGVPLGSSLTRAERLKQVRQQRDYDLESRQKVWRWLLVAALGVLVFETWWAGRAAREINSTKETVG